MTINTPNIVKKVILYNPYIAENDFKLYWLFQKTASINSLL